MLVLAGKEVSEGLQEVHQRAVQGKLQAGLEEVVEDSEAEVEGLHNPLQPMYKVLEIPGYINSNFQALMAFWLNRLPCFLLGRMRLKLLVGRFGSTIYTLYYPI